MSKPLTFPPAPPPATRTDVVLKAVQRALSDYRPVMDAPVDLRTITIDVKMVKNTSTVRCVIVTAQGEFDPA